MKQFNGITKVMFGVVAILLIVTLSLGVATVVKQGKAKENEPAGGKNPTQTASGTGTPAPLEATSTPVIMPTETPTPTPTTPAKHLVALDPGQQKNENKDTEPMGPGSTDTVKKMSYGATSVTTDMREHEWNLIMANLVKAELEARGYEVFMTRDKAEVDISNGERAVMANNSGAEILVGLQADAGGTGVNGVYAQLPKSDNAYVGNIYRDCRSLATFIKDAVIAATGASDRGYSESNKLAEINYSKIPVVIMQLGFMSNKEEDAKLQNDEYRQKMAKAICDGIDKYFDSKENDHE
ncbi:MAG: N-acetylmuramoyl-L-alanine amidase [Lachnospiraceae bacterium]|jgi:N-acetylmuramoyl-L-alanine amidase|nr:N-acetylmuramoyl-L-alanine amidase [Lachnospiraceae bacterium]